LNLRKEERRVFADLIALHYLRNREVQRVSLGIFGDVKPVGEGVLELREDIGRGYRVYIGRHGTTLVILLCAGDKHSQDADIRRARQYWLAVLHAVGMRLSVAPAEPASVCR
jgi:putative addiction module killer protein